MKIAIIDYGMGNIHSVRKALEYMGAETLVSSEPNDIRRAQKMVLPGVGAFDDAASQLDKLGLSGVIRDDAGSGKPLLGICLGMQLLFEESEEAKTAKGLGMIKGSVKKLPRLKGLKVPHMGWNDLNIKQSDSPLLKGIAAHSYVYFCHSYYPEPDEKDVIAATCEYGLEFCCVVQKANVFGAQFHPEKSQEAGLRILKNFVEFQ